MGIREGGGRSRAAAGEGERLARWAEAVGRSTLRRLRAVPASRAGLSDGRGGMSLADLARHLIDADEWLERKLRRPALAAMRGRAGSAVVGGAGWEALLDELERSGERRAELLRGLDREALDRRLPDERFGGEASVWWIVVRGKLEHEAHHRGQIAAGLRALGVAPVENRLTEGGG